MKRVVLELPEEHEAELLAALQAYPYVEVVAAEQAYPPPRPYTPEQLAKLEQSRQDVKEGRYITADAFRKKHLQPE